MSEPDNEPAQARKKLRTLLSEAGVAHERAPSGGRQMSFSGRYRDWQLFASANPSWFHIHTFVCSLPTEPGLRAELLLWMARANGAMSLLKYSVTPQDYAILEGEVRLERLEPDDVRNLIGYVHSVAEQDYLAVLHVARGDARLEALSEAFARDATADQGSANA